MKKIITLIVSLLILVSCAEKQENIESITINKKIENQKKIEEKMEVKNEEKENDLEEIKKLEERKKKIAEIKRKIKEKNLKKKEELDKSDKNILENNDIIKFCRNLADKGELFCQLHKSGDKKWNYHSGLIVKKIGNGEKIKLGDYIKYKIVDTNDKKWLGKKFIFYIGENLDGEEIHEKLLTGFPLGTEIIYYNSVIKLEEKVTKQDLINQYESLLDDKIKENSGKEQEFKEDFKNYFTEIETKLKEKLIYEKPIVQIVGNGQETGIIVNEIKYGNGNIFEKNSKVYTKNGDEIKEIGESYREIFIEDGKLTNGSKIVLKQYYNGGYGDIETEFLIVDKK